MAGSFAGKAVIVTGASSGIGRSIAVELGRQSADLWLVGRSMEELQITARHIAEAGGPEAQVAPLELRERGPFAELIESVGDAHPHLFALINNAGLMYAEPILSGSIDRWQAMFDVNVMAMLEGCKAVVEVMRGHGMPGHLINVGSMQARFEVPGVYGCTKRVVEGIGQTLRDELEQDDIRITSVIPGGFVSQLGRGLLPEAIAKIANEFTKLGLEPGGPGMEKLLADPQHIANVVRYILEEVVIRPPVSIKL
jgi:NADP-dependent 3-hydroxy acid dehydrogenase YdfG